MLIDWRARQPNPPPLVRGRRKHLLVRGRVFERDPADVDSITVHQTACVFGARPGRDRHERAFGVACHALAFADGAAVLPNPLRWHVHHGNGLNPRALGLEIEGRFPGLIGNPRTLANRRSIETPITDTLIAAAIEALTALVTLGRAEGMPIRYVHAHRQSSPSRRSDPGEEIWRRVVLEHGVRVLGLETQPALVLEARKGPGRPIPLEWDPAGVGRY